MACSDSVYQFTSRSVYQAGGERGMAPHVPASILNFQFSLHAVVVIFIILTVAVIGADIHLFIRRRRITNIIVSLK